MTPPSIVLLLPDLRGGGAERVAVNLANAFVRNGFRVEVLLMSAEGIFLVDLLKEVKVVDLKVRRLRHVLSPLVRHLRQTRPDALLAFMWPLTVIAVWARYFSCKETRVVSAEHTTWSRDELVSSFIMRWIVRITMRVSFPRADAVVAVSHGAADDLASFARLDRSWIHVIYNPIVKEEPHIEIQRTVELDSVRVWWGGFHRRVLAVGALKHIKDYPTLLRAFAKLRLRVDARLLILGEGECRIELSRLTHQLGLENFVFMPGFVKCLAPYYERADLHVLSSTGEGFGNVIVEALSAGTPVVSTDCQSGPREILLDGRFGSLVPVADPKALAVAMENALLASHDTESLKARAQDFSIEKAAGEYIALLFPNCNSLHALCRL